MISIKQSFFNSNVNFKVSYKKQSIVIYNYYLFVLPEVFSKPIINMEICLFIYC